LSKQPLTRLLDNGLLYGLVFVVMLCGTNKEDSHAKKRNFDFAIIANPWRLQQRAHDYSTYKHSGLRPGRHNYSRSRLLSAAGRGIGRTVSDVPDVQFE
jgi:hypothetical protein